MNNKGKLFRVLGLSSVMVTSMIMIATSSGASSSDTLAKGAPVTIGISLSLSGDFSADGQAYQQGYELWADSVNATGGLLGHKVVLDIVSDASSPTQVVTNYQDLISVKHVNLTFGPFSTLLTLPAAQAVNRYGYAMLEGAGGGPSVFQAGLKNVFDVTLPVSYDLAPFSKWLTSLPASTRPKTIAYVTSNDPFTQPVVDVAQKLIAGHGIKVVYNKVFPAEATDYTAIADAVVATKPQAVVLGSVDVPTVSAFMQAFEQAHFTPKVFVATAGPDQGQAFSSAVGIGNADGMMVPNSWYGSSPIASSRAMVAAYIKKDGGTKVCANPCTAASVNADIAEAYSVGEVMAQAVKATGGFNNAAIIKYLHTGVTLASVQGAVKFNALGENLAQTAYTFQWQGAKFVEVNPTTDKGAVPVLFPKPAWTS
jgi:branched-chain amino acid transport system substrate-binding protein